MVFTNKWSTPNFKVRVQRGLPRQHTFAIAIFALLQPVCQTLTKLWIPDDDNANFPYLPHAHEKAKLRQLASGPKPNYTEGSSCCWLTHLCRSSGVKKTLMHLKAGTIAALRCNTLMVQLYSVIQGWRNQTPQPQNY